MSDTARKSFIATLVAVLVIAGALAIWHLKVLVALLLLALVISSAMRPGVEWLRRHRIPRGLGVAIHYLAFLGVLAFMLWLIVPRALDQVQGAIGTIPTSAQDVAKAAKNSHGIKHEILVGLQHRLERLPQGTGLIHPAVTYGRQALEILVGVFFTFAVAAYWIFEKERAQTLILSLVKRKNRRVTRDTWDLIEAKLGAFVRGQLVMITFVSTVLSIAFWAIGLPYWLLLGVFAGIVEIVPVVGPLFAGVAAILAGLTVDVHTAALAAAAVFGLRLLQDYIIGPRVLGHAVGLSPLIVLVTVSSIGLLFGGFYVLLATPFAAVLATLLDVIVLDKDPAEEEVPKVIFSANDAEAG
ncbi:MAG TPA: AI-2E family transporter [Gaiellaceae bacterium]|nr:AI-2E family transporter [Gaiellaceae bacterium]